MATSRPRIGTSAPDHAQLDRRALDGVRQVVPSLAELANVGKRTAKAIPGSTCVRDGQTMLTNATG